MAGTFYQRDGRITSSATDSSAMTDAHSEMRAELRYLIAQPAGNQVTARIIALRAALAKIAQEGKP